MPAHEPKQPSAPAPSPGEPEPAPAVAVSGGLVNVDQSSVAEGTSAAGRETLGQQRPRTIEVMLAPDLGDPRRFRDYVLIEKIKEGGMGTVFKARDALLPEKEYALKVIRSDLLANAALREQFLTEMQTMNRLRTTPTPTSSSSVGTGKAATASFTFPCRTKVAGSLAALVKKLGPPNPRDAAELVRQAAEAVEHANDLGIFHCDLKPHNILLSNEGTAKVTDFGLARLKSKANAAGTRGEPVGTPNYMAPEQAEGRNEQIGPLTDVYGLGAVLYHLLTGKPPHGGERDTVEETLRQAREVPPTRPRKLNPRVPRRLEAICLKCLQKNPGDRFDSAAQAAAALQGFLRPWWKRQWRRAVVGAALLLLCGLLVFWFGYEAPRLEAENTAKTADLARDKQPDEARRKYEKARGQYEELLRNPFSFFDGADLRLRLARVQNHLGRLQEDERVDKPDETLGRAETTLEGLLASDPDRPEALGAARRSASQPGHVFRRPPAVVQGEGTSIERTGDPQASQGGAGAGRRFQAAAESVLRFPGRQRPKSVGRRCRWSGTWRRATAGWATSNRRWARIRGNRTARASDIRQASFTKHPTAKTLYLHARDFGNMGNYYDRAGEVEKAIDQYRLRLDCYENHRDISTADLPQNYRDEPAGTRVAVAELELDMGRKGDPEKVAQWLNDAEADYQDLLKKCAGRGPPSPFGRVSPVVCRPGQTGARHEFAEPGGRSWPTRRNSYSRLWISSTRPERTTTTTGRWLARYGRDWPWGTHARSPMRTALNHLESAVNNNFNQRKRLERDRCLLEPYADPQKPRFDKLFGRVQ